MMFHNEQVASGYLASLNVMTYNIHSCINTLGRVDPDAILQVIDDLSPDIVALQEVDVRRSRSHFMDQPKLFADTLDMYCDFYSLINKGAVKYGLAILSRYPFKKVKYGVLSTASVGKAKEPRGAMWIKLTVREISFNFINTHLGLQQRERLNQSRKLFSDKWLLGLPEKEPTILCGDFNAISRSRACREISLHLNDVQREIKRSGYPKNTFHSSYPFLRIDHIFTSAHFEPIDVHVPATPLTRQASDHLPVFAEVAMKGKEK